MEWLTEWLRRRRRMTEVLEAPESTVAVAPGSGDPRLADLEEQARQLLVAFEGVNHDALGDELLHRLQPSLEHSSATEQDESRMEVAERARWMNDAFAWARAAKNRAVETGGPYRDRGMPQVPVRLREIADTVLEELQADSAAGAAAAIERFLRP